MAHKSWKFDQDATAATFNISGGSSFEIDAVDEVSIGQNGDSVVSSSEGANLAQGFYTDNTKATITVTGKDIKGNVTLERGDFGRLIIRGIKRRTQGNGLDDSDEIVFNFGMVIVDTVDSTIPGTGESSAVITFESVDNGSGSLYTTSAP